MEKRMYMLKIVNLSVDIENKNILHDFNLNINKGEIHAIMGPNGIGKSTICKTIMGDENYTITRILSLMLKVLRICPLMKEAKKEFI